MHQFRGWRVARWIRPGAHDANLRHHHRRRSKRGVVDSVRGAEIKAGNLKMPQSAILYQLFAPRDSVDAGGAHLKSPTSLNVVYLPYATTETTGISTTPSPGTPWLMFPGKPWAHIMISQ